LLSAPLRPSTARVNDPTAVYAVASGPVSTGGFSAATAGGGASIVKNHPTSGVISNGALVEREVKTTFATKPVMVLQLRNPDFTTAQRISQMINNSLGTGLATAKSPGAVSVLMPTGVAKRMEFMANLEVLQVSPDAPARVTYNERTGTIVMGGNVRISQVIINHGNLIFEKQQDFFQTDQTLMAPGVIQNNQNTTMESELTVTEPNSKFQVIEEGVTIGEVASGLNALGVTARDIISILQLIEENGALQAELIAK
jgi:flagellar P-ring protein precursor FlgI